MKIGFKCSACGKCCNAAPSLKISEAFEFQDDFISIPRIFSAPARATEAGEKETHDIGLVYARKTGSSDQALQIGAVIVAYSTNTKKCQMRDVSGKCRLHAEGRKPMACRCVPLDTNVPDEDFPDIINDRTYHRCIRSDEECRPDDEIVWEDGAYCEESPIVRARAAERKAIMEDNKDLSPIVSFLVNETTSRRLFGQPLINMLADNPGNSISVPMPLFFDAAACGLVSKFNNPNLADKERVLEFYRHQIPLLEKHVGSAEEIYRGLLADMLSSYKHILKEA